MNTQLLTLAGGTFAFLATIFGISAGAVCLLTSNYDAIDGAAVLFEFMLAFSAANSLVGGLRRES